MEITPVKLALATAALVMSWTANAAEPAKLALTCHGIVKHGIPGPGTDYYPGKQGKPEPVSIVIVLNFTTRKVEEITGALLFRRINITQASEAYISLLEDGDHPGFMAGINRLTGEMDAGDTVQVKKLYSTTSYEMKCSPVQRMF
jgi:hypothetical protein